jgi:cell division transport system permease protein
MSILAVLIVTVALFVFGSFIMVAMNLKNVSVLLNDKMDVMVYLQPQARVDTLEEVKNTLTNIQGVRKIQFISKEEAWEKFSANYSGLELQGVVDENPLPDAFRVSMEDIDYIEVLVSKVNGLDGVDEVRYGKDTAEKMKQLIFLINLVGLILVAILFFATLLIVVNTIRLTIMARQNEIDIMLLVGATRSFISLPFIIEGLIIGAIGGILSVAAMIMTYSAVLLNIREKLVFIPLALTENDLITVYFMVVFFGLILGAIGSSLSVNRAIKLE